MPDPRPVGVFDSGVGGLTVLRAIHDLLPGESTIYLGDVARFPYGPKPQPEIQSRVLELTRYLVDQGVKLLVIACNTATAAALDDVVGAYDLPVIGVIEPGAAEAVAVSRGQVIGVVGTEGTVGSGAYVRTIQRLSPTAEVHQFALTHLVRPR